MAGARRFAALLAACVAVAFGVSQLVKSVGSVSGSAEAYSYVDAWRSVARTMADAHPALFCEDAEAITPVERSRLIAVAWEHPSGMPHAVDRNGRLSDENSVLASRWLSLRDRGLLLSAGLGCSLTNEYVCGWRPKAKEGVPVQRKDGAPGLVRESLSMALIGLLVFCAWSATKDGPFCGFSSKLVVAAALLFGLLCFAVLQHPLLPPNGLGTYGGKAKLLWHNGGAPKGFWNGRDYGVLQPAYPPGLTLLALLHFILSGGCGDRLVQILLPFAFSILLLELGHKTTRGMEMLPALMYLLSPLSIKLASGFYAEPFAAIALLSGWRMMRDGRLLPGSFAMSFAGLFRLEAGVVAAIYAFVHVVATRWDIRRAMACLFLSAGPMLCWVMMCRMMGCWISDWDFSVHPSLAAMAHAFVYELKSTLSFVLPTVALMLCASGGKICTYDRIRIGAWTAFGLLILAMPAVCGFYAGRDGAWMVDNTVPRLIWYMAMIPLSELRK